MIIGFILMVFVIIGVLLGVVVVLCVDLFEVNNFQKYFFICGGLMLCVVVNVKVVNDIIFCVGKGEVVGFIGEFGFGKIIVGCVLLCLIELMGGQVIFNGIDIIKLGKFQMCDYCCEMQIIFQDFFVLFNLCMMVSDIFGEVMQIYNLYFGKVCVDCIVELLQCVGLCFEYMGCYFYEFLGGQCQCIGIVCVLVVDFSFIVVDELVLVFDVFIQVQVVNLIQDFQEEFGLMVLFIVYDLYVVEYICDCMIVMYLGCIMEIVLSCEFNCNFKYFYIEVLFLVFLVFDFIIKCQCIIFEGDIFSFINLFLGCVFCICCCYVIVDCVNIVFELCEVLFDYFKVCICDDIF